MNRSRMGLCVATCVVMTLAKTVCADPADDARLIKKKAELAAESEKLKEMELMLKNFRDIQYRTNELVLGKVNDRTAVSQQKAAELAKIKRFNWGWYIVPTVSVTQLYDDLNEIGQEKPRRRYRYISPGEGRRLANAFLSLKGSVKVDTGPKDNSAGEVRAELVARANVARAYTEFWQLHSSLMSPHLPEVQKQRELVRDLEWQTKPPVTVLGVPTDTGNKGTE
jgi:hypothetical protein